MEQTAVEWLVNEMIEKKFFAKDAPLSYTTLEHLTNQAKEMEKEQIKKLLEIIIWYDEESDVRPDAEIYNWFKQYYNETFKSE